MEKVIKITAVGELQTAKDGRQWYSVEFQDKTNIFSPKRTRNIWQQKNSAGEPVWKTLSHEEATKRVGTLIPGEIIEREVEPYDVVDTSTGESRTVSKYTAVVFGNEDVASTFKGLGHPLAGSNSGMPKALEPSTTFDANPAILDTEE